jgi:hypothetical protein
LDEKQERKLGWALRRAALYADFGGAKVGRLLLLFGGIAILVFAISIVLSPMRLVETVEGRPASTFITPAKYFGERMHVQVTLEDGRSVSVTMPRKTQMKYAPMTIEILEHRLGPFAYTQYRFAGYVDEPD